MPASAKRSLRLALGVTLGFFLVELGGGLYTNSLSLMADAFHMLLDSMALLISFAAVVIAERPSNPVQTYGYRRAEILAAFFNAMILLGLSSFLIFKASARLTAPAPVRELPMLIIAASGLGVNLANLFLLRRAQKESLNVRSAYLHVLGDSLGSLVVIVAAVLIAGTGNTIYDALGSLAISGLILVSAMRLFLKTLAVLMEASPSHLSTAEIQDSFLALPGVRGVHDLHVWTLTSGFEVLSAHLTVTDLASSQEILSGAQEMLRQRYGITHPTIQIETDFHPECLHGHGTCA
jgi:cobalt-zinc-cadmium efflux system protein